MSDFIKILEAEFIKNANPEYAIAQKAYLKNRFEFYGMKAPQRRGVQKPFLFKAFLPPKGEYLAAKIVNPFSIEIQKISGCRFSKLCYQCFTRFERVFYK